MKNLLIILCLAVAALGAFSTRLKPDVGVPQSGSQDVSYRKVEASLTPSYEPHGTPLTIQSSAYCLQGQTASGQWVRDGIAASNFLPFRSFWTITSGPLKGKEVQILDRHHKRYHKLLDVWVESCPYALEYGRRDVQIRRAR